MASRIILSLICLVGIQLSPASAHQGDEIPAQIWGMDKTEAPPAKDFVGIAGFHFGMSGAKVEARAKELSYKPLSSREGNRRFRGKLLGRRMEIMAALSELPTGGKGLSRLVIHWDSRESSAGKALEPYIRLQEWLSERFGPARVVEEAGQAHLATASGANRRFYERVDSGEQAILELVPRSPGDFQLRLTLIRPEPAKPQG